MEPLLGGSWVVISGVIGVPLRVPLKGIYRDLGFRVVISRVVSPLIRVISIVTLFITLLLTTPRP